MAICFINQARFYLAVLRILIRQILIIAWIQITSWAGSGYVSVSNHTIQIRIQATKKDSVPVP